MDLEEIERIKQLKYTYFRAVDQKDWDLFRSCFALDATTSYENGTLGWQGIEAIVEGLTSCSPALQGERQSSG